MSENVLEFDVAVEKGVYRRFIIEVDQGIVKLICDGKAIPLKNIKDLETGEALLVAIADTTAEIMGENDITVNKTSLIEKIQDKSIEYENVTKGPVEEEKPETI